MAPGAALLRSSLHPAQRQRSLARFVSFDTALALGMFVVASADILWTRGIYSVRPHVVPALLCGAVMCGVLWWRRRRPLLTVTVALLGVAVMPLLGLVPQAWLAPYLCLVAYSAGAADSRWRSGSGLVGAILAGWVVATTAVGDTGPNDYLWTVAMLGIAWVGGAVLHRRKALAARERASALADQRTRIARELHDSVAHSLTVIAMTADAAELALLRDPELATTPVRNIRGAAQDALADMRRLVGMLRADQESTQPEPGLSDLPTLAEQVRATGMPVTVSLQGDVRELPAGIDLAAYRIVQEALTNARRHTAKGGRAWVDVRRDATALQLEIVNDGTARPSSAGSGTGLLGLRERVALYHGVLDAAPMPEGGFRVAASLPLRATP